MTKKLIKEYYKNILLSFFFLFITWFLLCYFLFFHNQSTDGTSLDHLSLGFSQYISIQQKEVSISTEGLDALTKSQAWIQVLDANNQVIYAKDAPSHAPSSYSAFELVDMVLTSGRMDGQTVYMTNKGEYPILLGCAQELIHKQSLSISSRELGTLLFALLLFLLLSFFVIALNSLGYVKRITIPIAQMIKSVEQISKEEVIHYPQKGNPVFDNVFAQLEQLQHRLEENKKQRDIWISNLSHDLKTPLSSIKGYAEVMRDYQLKEEELAFYSSEILTSEKRIEDLLSELSLYQKLAEGKLYLQKRPCDLGLLLQECTLELCPALADPLQISIETPAECIIALDAPLFHRALSNILWNCVLHNKDSVQISIFLEQVEETLILTIKDNGIGIPANELPRIFERYYRGTASQHSKGTGLGLAICREIILAHGGTIEVSSNVNLGTTFKIELNYS